MRIGDWSSDVCSSDLDPDRPRLDAAGQHAADKIVAVEQGRKEAERPVGVETGGGNMADDRFEQRLEIAVARLWVRRGETLAARGIEDREIELVVAPVKRQAQPDHLVEPFGRARVAAVDPSGDADQPTTE